MQVFHASWRCPDSNCRDPEDRDEGRRTGIGLGSAGFLLGQGARLVVAGLEARCLRGVGVVALTGNGACMISHHGGGIGCGGKAG